MKKSQDALEKGMQKKSLKSQQQSIESLKKLKEKLQSMQQESANDKPVEDMESLRKILENLVKLSFDQEDLITKVKNTPKNSSEFIKIVRKQNKLADDSKIIEEWEEEDKTITTESLMFDESSEIHVLKDDTED